MSFLPSPKERKTKPLEIANDRPGQPSQASKLDKKSTRLTEETAKTPWNPLEEENRREEPDALESNTVAHRPLPTLNDLLPPATRSPPEGRRSSSEDAVRLDTRDPKYVSYLTSVKRAIELVWEYPEPALRHRVQGKLVVEFTILGNGVLEGTELIQSSGFPVLDREAIRAVRAAAPFQPIPPRIGKARIDIIASFEYHDNRLRAGGTGY